MKKIKTLGIITICIASILIIGGIIGLEKYNKMTNPHKAFEKDLKQQQNLQKQKDTQDKTDLQDQNVQEKEKQPNLDLDNKAFSKNVINILLLGIDSDDTRELEKAGYRSDSIILTSVDLDTKEVKMLSIPRDSYTYVPGNKNKDKINHAMSFGGGPNKKGNQYAVKAVEDLLGIDINYYITMDMEVVKSIVDTIGGVTINVERDMGYDDFPLGKGEQKLNGSQSLIYLRDRNTSTGDFARIKQQQKFMIALFKQVKENGKLSDVLPLYLKMQDKISTDLKIEQMGALALLLKDIEADKIETFTLQGKGLKINGIYYLDIDKAHMESIIKKHFQF